MPELADAFADLEDPPAVNARLHSLHDILTRHLGHRPAHRRLRRPDWHRHGTVRPGQTGVSGVLSGAGKRHSQPRYLFPGAGQTGSGSFRAVVCGVHGTVCRRRSGVVAEDGKTLRRSYDRAPGRSALHLINAWAEEQRPVLGQPAFETGLTRLRRCPSCWKC